MEDRNVQRQHVLVTGIVQGVGFRPFVYHTAEKLGLFGWVRNDAGGVQIEVEGPPDSVAEFIRRLRTEAPPLSRVDEITLSSCPVQGSETFQIRHSDNLAARTALLSPDMATCPDCRRELMASNDRRFGYPFINCTNCGPRYSIIKDIPYDRPYTTMAEFVMCPDCRQEFDHPGDRRFHAQPNACAVCGPRYQLLDRQGRIIPGSDADVFAAARRLIADGAVIAIKGIGGFHLACDAYNGQAVQKLRERKTREDKPFAVLCGSVDAVRKHCVMKASEQEVLTSKERPIVLLAKGPDYSLAQSIAPGNPFVGVMLPYAPPHWLLLKPEDIWVMTSGNTSDEPIAYEDQDALERLAGIADAFLVHNRVIHRPVDDSVVRLFRDEIYPLRRSRGYVPAPVSLAVSYPPVLACGGELKNAFCLTRGRQAFMSSHIGDLENMSTYQTYTDTIEHFQRLFAVRPEIAAYDLHPDYLATRYAQSLSIEKIGVQHHHAHIASVLAEHGINRQVIGVALDGTGFGTDGHLWGGEFMLADCRDFTRVGHCRYLPLPGGAKAIKEPWRLAATMLYHLYGREFLTWDIPFVHSLPPEWELVVQASAKGINSPLSSSAGRLFDLAAALTGIRGSIHYEGQAAVELELAALRSADPGKILPYDIQTADMLLLDFAPVFAAMAFGLRRKAAPELLAASFQRTMAAAVADMVRRIALQSGLREVALSGGVFQNGTLLAELFTILEKSNFTVYIHRQVPPNDGGLALGQAVIAGERSR
ncbi:MAG: hypF [Firmicutes bacterium]|nr:hypF [Bacillota bacterium]